MRPCAGICEAIAHIERGRTPALAELSAGLQSEIIFALADPDDLKPEQVAQPFHPIPRGLGRKDVAPAKAGHGLPERDRRSQARPIAFEHGGFDPGKKPVRRRGRRRVTQITVRAHIFR